MLVPALPHCAGHCEVKQLVRRDGGASVVRTPKRRGTQRGSTAAKRAEGIVDGPSEGFVSLLPIPWEISSA